MFLVTSSFVINVPTRGLLAVESMHAIVQWLANLNIKRNMTSMFVNKKHRYKHSRNFQHSHLYFQMPELCSVEFVDIYMALYCHTQTIRSVVMNATSGKHMTVFSFGNFNRFGVVAVNG